MPAITVMSQVEKDGKMTESCGFPGMVPRPAAASPGSLLEVHSFRAAPSEVLGRVEPNRLFLTRPLGDSDAR